MEKKIKLCVVGAGNISNTRHIPAIKKNKNAEIGGVIGQSIDSVESTAKKLNTLNYCLFDEMHANRPNWFSEIDAVVIGVPPKQHFEVAKYCLEQKKHVLLEKPFTMSVSEGEFLIDLAEKNKLIFSVMHNFQFANGIVKLEKLIKDGLLGEINSFFEIQLTNNTRRLPEWHNDLPLGLFYDEAAHFIYLLQKFGGNIEVLNAFVTNNRPGLNTPLQMNVNLQAGPYPVTLYINFDSPICEWNFLVIGSKQIAIYDFFRDILITIPNDGLHLAKDVFSNSFNATVKHWIGFAKNGFSLVLNRLYWGHDIVVENFVKAIETNNTDYITGINAKNGLENIRILNDIIDKAKTY